MIAGVARAWISIRKNGRAFIEVKLREEDFQQAIDRFNSDGISFTTRENRYLRFNVGLQQLKEKVTTHEWLASTLSPPDVRLSAQSQTA
jgi:hypothetical protein